MHGCTLKRMYPRRCRARCHPAARPFTTAARCNALDRIPRQLSARQHTRCSARSRRNARSRPKSLGWAAQREALEKMKAAQAKGGADVAVARVVRPSVGLHRLTDARYKTSANGTNSERVFASQDVVGADAADRAIGGVDCRGLQAWVDHPHQLRPMGEVKLDLLFGVHIAVKWRYHFNGQIRAQLPEAIRRSVIGELGVGGTTK